MSLLNIGLCCSHAACSEIDFLPIVCKCNKSFCRHHIAQETHQCSAVNTGSPIPLHSFDKLRRRCDASNCSNPSLNAFTSSQDVIPTCVPCKQSFCAIHRHPSSHSCLVQESSPSEKANAARAMLSKHFPASKRAIARRVAKTPTDPVKLAQIRKVELIKMRHRAKPGNPKEGPQLVPFDQRLHLKCKGDGDEENVLWFRKTMVAGKVLDLLVAKITSSSGQLASLQLNKILENGEKEILRNDKPIGDQAEDGDTVVVIQSN